MKPRKIAILGGGLTGLTTTFYLARKGYQVTVFEKEEVLGGLVAGFKQKNWDWYLEKTVHHLFANDGDILSFAKEIGFNKVFFKSPETASLFSDLTIHPMDTPIDFLKLPYLGLFNKFRAGAVLAFLKLSPFFPFYEKTTSEEFLKKTMGKKTWNKLWQELFRGKFGIYAGNILASFIWARIKKRTKKLGYIEGGFQALIDYLVNQLTSLRVNVLTGYEIREIKKRGEKYLINNQLFDAVISTLPTPVLIKIGENIFPKNYLSRLKKIKYLHSLSLVLETDQPILKKTYWLNINTKEIPIMGIFQQTNFVDKKYYGGKHVTYIGWYVDDESEKLRMSNEELLKFVTPYLLKIFNFQFSIFKNNVTNFQQQISNFYVFKSQYAQPIFNKEFLKNKPDFKTPLNNFFIANLDMTYPYDRGTNYAVKLGKEVSKFIR